MKHYYSIVKKSWKKKKIPRRHPTKQQIKTKQKGSPMRIVLTFFFLRQVPYLTKHDKSNAESTFWELSLSLFLLIWMLSFLRLFLSSTWPNIAWNLRTDGRTSKSPHRKPYSKMIRNRQNRRQSAGRDPGIPGSWDSFRREKTNPFFFPE